MLETEKKLAAWQNGWWQHARKSASPNFSPRPAGMGISLIVLHSISLPPEEFGGLFVEDFFLNRLDHAAHPYFAQLRGMQVSAHFFLRRDGEIIQFVSILDRAWHAGRSSWQGRENCNDYSIGIELEGSEHQPFASRQYAALWPLLTALCEICPITAIVGHEHIAPDRKTDPGAFFDWQELAKRLPGKITPG
ncbi:MAG: 1,6-anhydro-N-acetylmuramyl-L-alanine amidase AmpD [Betaproteobacteria bacterium]|nr:1,6-anhydro-N-acetylmuramyl-L-alanine amidase AmpD [Betaproteobacteria bacterium]